MEAMVLGDVVGQLFEVGVVGAALQEDVELVGHHLLGSLGGLGLPRGRCEVTEREDEDQAGGDGAKRRCRARPRAFRRRGLVVSGLRSCRQLRGWDGCHHRRRADQLVRSELRFRGRLLRSIVGAVVSCRYFMFFFARSKMDQLK